MLESRAEVPESSVRLTKPPLELRPKVALGQCTTGRSNQSVFSPSAGTQSSRNPMASFSLTMARVSSACVDPAMTFFLPELGPCYGLMDRRRRHGRHLSKKLAEILDGFEGCLSEDHGIFAPRRDLGSSRLESD
ncbi:hypothetical protein D6C85_07126 [Aureobasidium pullulans]|uniref:Uncharacterized protein n=1 Tax=Aureobasidium pullulans TaxID=5580 RepID=A0A4T0AU85_AURPU|nr:hypothetical protein D6C85_07126 [Aureobasidium pullulans]TIA22055.1 hypothetical protein D6C81_03524 [Aureobasidium pullulans]